MNVRTACLFSLVTTDNKHILTTSVSLYDSIPSKLGKEAISTLIFIDFDWNKTATNPMRLLLKKATNYRCENGQLIAFKNSFI
ncbi:hypothetical protein [Brochothrix thermosphacta]|uniref:hypothetical protein n=1 Tax=Brochothrix thermosphacta TaxID=2756 RepID=UPI0039AFE49F